MAAASAVCVSPSASLRVRISEPVTMPLLSMCASIYEYTQRWQLWQG